MGIGEAGRVNTGSGVDQSHLPSRDSLFFINERAEGVGRGGGPGEFRSCSLDIHRLITVPMG